MEPKPPEELSPPQYLPIISEKTKVRLLEELGLDNDPKTREIIQGISGRTESPRKLAESLTINILSDLAGYNRKFVLAMDEELTKIDPHAGISTDRTIGMAIILRAFEIDSDFDLISRFNNLGQEDIEIAMRTIQENTASKPLPDIPILKRILSAPRIPEQQVALNGIVKDVDKSYIPEYIGYLTEGTAIMYVLLSHLWPKLYPQNPSPIQPPPQPNL